MDRITGNQAKSLMEAYAQVYTKPAVENLNEQVKTTKEGERYTDLPGGGSRKALQTAVKGGMRVRWEIDKDGKGSWIPDQPEFKPNLQYVGASGVETKRIDPTKDDMGEPLKKTEPVRQPVRQPVREKPAPAPAPAAKTYTVGGKQMTKAQINTEYRRLVNSKDPEERKQATQFGKEANKAIFKPATSTTAGGTKFERRTPTSAELAAAKKAGGGEAGLKAATSIAKPTTPTTTTTPTPNSQGGGVQNKLNQSFQNKPGVSQSQIDFMSKQPPAEVQRLNQRYNTNYAPGKSPTGPGTVQGASLRSEIDRVRTALSTNQTPATQSAGNAMNTALSGRGALSTRMNSDSSLKVNNKRSPEKTNEIKRSLELQSADLFDIVKGKFLEEGYSEEDTMYMMANLDENILKKFVIDPIMQVGKPFIKRGLQQGLQQVGRMFGRTPAAPTIGSGNIAALRLHQNKAHQSLQRLNQQSTRLNANDARRAAATADPTRSRLANDPRLVSDRNAREAAAQVRARNRELGRPEWAGPQPVDSLNYKPGDPQFTRSLRQYYADKRAGVKGLPEEFVNENIGRLGARLIQGVARKSPHVYGKAVKAIRDTGVSRLIPDMNVSPGVVRNTGRGMGIRPIKPAPPKPPLDPAQRYQLLPNTKYGDPVLATPGGRPPVSTPSVSAPTPTPLPANPMGQRASGTESALNILKRQKMKRNK